MPAEDLHARDGVDTTALDAVAAKLTRSSTAALDASHELLAHYADTGDASTQRTVGTLIDHAADTLRALTDSIAETASALQALSRRATPVLPDGTDLPGARSGRRRDRFL